MTKGWWLVMGICLCFGGIAQGNNFMGAIFFMMVIFCFAVHSILKALESKP